MCYPLNPFPRFHPRIIYQKRKCRPSPPSSGTYLQSKLTIFPAKSPAPPRLGGIYIDWCISSKHPQTLRLFPREVKNIKHDRYFPQGLESKLSAHESNLLSQLPREAVSSASCSRVRQALASRLSFFRLAKSLWNQGNDSNASKKLGFFGRNSTFEILGDAVTVN